jgi:Cu-processing system permease protein
MRVIALAKFTLKSYLQEKVLLVVMIFAALLMLSSYVLSPLAVGAQQKVVVDIGLAAISIFAVALIVLLGAGSFHLEKERGILRALLAKPISRVEFVLGKYAGTVAMVSIVVVLMAGVHMLVVTLSGAEVTNNMLIAVFLTLLEGAVVTALLTLFSSFTSPVLGSFFTISSVVAGHFSSDLLAFADRMGGTAPKLVAGGAYYLLPNLELLNVRSEAVHALALPAGFVGTVTLYAVAYAAVVLYLATVIFRAREVS